MILLAVSSYRVRAALSGAVFSAAGAAICLAGCSLHDVALEPAPLSHPPEQFSLTPDATWPADSPWWESFGDAALNELVSVALSENLTLRQGLERITAARAFAVQARAARLPQVSGTGEVRRDWERLLNPRESEAAEAGSSGSGEDGGGDESEGDGGGSGGGRDGGDGGGAPDARWETGYEAGLELRWELDFWGRLRSLNAAQLEELAATQLDYEALRLSLSRAVVEAYFGAQSQRLELALLADQREFAARYLELVELRFLQGEAAILEVLQQRAQVAEIDTQAPLARAALVAFENELDVLLGQVADGEERTELPSSLPLAALPPDPGVPVTLLSRRPDLAAAQRRVVAGDHEVAAAIAERLPSITLTGTFAYSGVAGGDRLLTGGAGAGLFQPLLDWGARRAAVTAAQSNFRSLLLGYTEQYLGAIEEVETTLWQERHQRTFMAALEARRDLLSQAVNEARIRYGQGVSDYLPVLTAMTDLNEVERELNSARLQYLNLRARLHAATGAATRRVELAPAAPARQARGPDAAALPGEIE